MPSLNERYAKVVAGALHDDGDEREAETDDTGELHAELARRVASLERALATERRRRPSAGSGGARLYGCDVCGAVVRRFAHEGARACPDCTSGVLRST